MHWSTPSALIPYKFVIVPEGPLEGAWVDKATWERVDNEAMGDMTDDAVRQCDDYAHHLIRTRHIGGPDWSDEIDYVIWKLADDDNWAKVQALAAMGLAKFFEYDPAKRKDDEL